MYLILIFISSISSPPGPSTRSGPLSGEAAGRRSHRLQGGASPLAQPLKKLRRKTGRAAALVASARLPQCAALLRARRRRFLRRECADSGHSLRSLVFPFVVSKSLNCGCVNKAGRSVSALIRFGTDPPPCGGYDAYDASVLIDRIGDFQTIFPIRWIRGKAS